MDAYSRLEKRARQHAAFEQQSTARLVKCLLKPVRHCHGIVHDLFLVLDTLVYE